MFTIIIPTFAVSTVVVYLSFDLVRSSDNDCGAYTAKMDEHLYQNHRLTSHIFESSSNNYSPLECYVKCLKNCLCVSFNFCKLGKKCELNSERKQSNVYEQTDDCDYYEYDYTNQASSGRCLDTCCSNSQPCLNGGKCHPNCLFNGKRFRCSCPDGFKGIRCEVKPRSCKDYGQSSNQTAGLRLIFAPDDSSYLVFCDFVSSSTISATYTLVMSYKRSNSVVFDKSLTKDFPREENAPGWNDYRLSLARMKALRDESTDWSLMCMYPSRGLASEDYVRVKIAKTDILTYTKANGGTCRHVEVVRINGKTGWNVKLGMGQATSIFHVGAHLAKKSCGAWKAYTQKKCVPKYARYFGSYICTDTNFSCMKYSYSTTQLWFIHTTMKTR